MVFLELRRDSRVTTGISGFLLSCGFPRKMAPPPQPTGVADARTRRAHRQPLLPGREPEGEMGEYGRDKLGSPLLCEAHHLR